MYKLVILVLRIGQSKKLSTSQSLWEKPYLLVDWPLSRHESWGNSSQHSSWPLSSTQEMFMLSFPYRKYCHPDPKKQHSESNICAKPIGKGLLEADCTQNFRKHQDPRPQHILKEKRPSILMAQEPQQSGPSLKGRQLLAVPEHHSSSRC